MKAVEFLRKFHPGRPWVLTAIAADRKGIETRAFTNEDKAEEWIASWDGKRNLYFSVNEVIRAEAKKAERENIEAVHWLHVDVDAEPGKDLAEELERIKRLVTTKLPDSVPKPTCVLFSGGGYQAFWRLTEPVPIHGNLEAAEHAKLFNKQLEVVFGGDHCHNIDRIMRLPDTLNIPDAKKVAKGRVPVKSKVISFTRKTHDLAAFNQAAAVDLGTGGEDVEISGNVPRLASVDDLDDWKVPDRVKVIIVQGYDPDEPKDGDNSRSAWLFDCVCNLARMEVPDDVIYGVITDPGFKISESVLEASNSDRYAKKQIKSAREAVISPWLQQLNAQFAVIGNLGGKCRVVEEVYDESLRRTRLVKSTFEDYRNRFMNQHETINIGNGKTKLVPVGKWWLEHPQRRQYDRLVFAPGQEIADVYNLWRGYGCNAIPGKAHEPFLAHLHEIICDGNRTHYDYLVSWLAQAVQRPDLPGGTAIVMRGRPGTGKSFFAKHVGHLFGRHFLHVSNAAHLVGNFNSHLRDAIVVFGDEAFFAGDKRHESVLKTLITEETLIIEAKGVDAEACPNYTHMILASNNAWVVPAGAADRRFFVVDVSESRERDTAYFGQLQQAMNNGGYEALLHFLLHHDIRTFDVQDVPDTDALAEQKTMTLEPHEEWWLSCLVDCRLAGQPWHDTPFPKELLWESYVEHCASVQSYKMVNRHVLGHFIARVTPDTWPRRGRKRHDGHQVATICFPPVQLCRSTWDKFNRTSTIWDDPDSDEEPSDLPF